MFDKLRTNLSDVWWYVKVLTVVITLIVLVAVGYFIQWLYVSHKFWLHLVWRFAKQEWWMLAVLGAICICIWYYRQYMGKVEGEEDPSPPNLRSDEEKVKVKESELTKLKNKLREVVAKRKALFIPLFVLLLPFVYAAYHFHGPWTKFFVGVPGAIAAILLLAFSFAVLEVAEGHKVLRAVVLGTVILSLTGYIENVYHNWAKHPHATAAKQKMENKNEKGFYPLPDHLPPDTAFVVNMKEKRVWTGKIRIPEHYRIEFTPLDMHCWEVLSRSGLGIEHSVTYCVGDKNFSLDDPEIIQLRGNVPLTRVKVRLYRVA